MRPRNRRPHGLGALAILVLAGVGACLGACTGDAAEDALPAPARKASVPVEPGPGDLFEDVSARAGLADFVHRLADGDLSNVIEALGAGGTFLDFDGDGWLDLYLVQGAALPGISKASPGADVGGNRLFRNLGNGRFEDVTARSGVGDRGFGVAAVAADYDSDGHTDLYVVNVGPNVLYRNRGDGSFEDVTEAAGVGDPGSGVGAVWFDADGDHRLDLFVVNYLSFDPDYVHHYGPDAYPGPLAYAPEMNVLYRNLGDGRFEDVSAASGIRIARHRGMAVAAFDCDRDGDQDIYVTNDATANLLLVNDGKGHFRDGALDAQIAYGQDGDATASMAADIGDVDGDGRADILVTDTSYGSLYVANAAGAFDDRAMASGLAALAGQYGSWGGNFVDFDDDGDLDITVVNGDLHYLLGWEDLLVENGGDAHFTDARARGGAWFEARLCGRGSAVADFDNDGRVDLLVTHLADRPALLRNRGVARNHWLTLDLEGTRSNRDGFGAVVRVEAGGKTWTAEARCPTGYLCQGDPRLHFGLGAAGQVARVTIRWPSGCTQVLTDVTADRILPVREPEEDR